MPGYDPPVREMRFVLDTIAGLPGIAALPGYESATPDTVTAILEAAAGLARDVLAPLDQPGDHEGARLENGVVRTPAGFSQAYRSFVEGGWNGLPFAEAHGGQGLPLVVATAVAEMWTAANMSFALCPLLTAGAVEALERHGSEALKAQYLEKLVSGAWTGTMDLTEPQAGSDVGAVKTRAVPDGAHWRISGQKIYITYGDHDLAENILHFVLARTPGSPAGTRGISLFLVPKFLPDAEGRPGRRNDVRCVSLEHKLGIHASPTAVLAFGDEGGAIGFLVGEEQRGMACMFTMMNNARLSVGLQGVAISERVYQQARDFARERVQGGAAIIRHPDVRRMLLLMRSRTEASRALAYFTASCLDIARRSPDAARRAQAQSRAELLVPMVKAWCTDIGVENASLAIQVHGGMGFIEETGVAQHYRDIRIAPIYEGTNGIQAMDLLGRKLARDEGAAARALIAEMRALDAALAARSEDGFAVIRAALAQGIDAVETASASLLAIHAADPGRAAAGAVPFLTLFATVTGGWLLAKAALAIDDPARRLSARFYAESVLPQATALLPAITSGSTVIDFAPELL